MDRVYSPLPAECQVIGYVSGYGFPIGNTTGSMVTVKTTIDIHDGLLLRAKQAARETRRPLRAVVEEGLRLVLDRPRPVGGYVLPDLRQGDPEREDPLERYSWPELRELIYGDPGTR